MFTRYAAVLLSILCMAAEAQALRVSQVKGDQALVSLEDGDSPNEGDQYFVMINGKKLGLVQITKVKGKRAIAKLKKGRADVGSELSLARAAGSGGGGSSQASRGTKRSRRGDSMLNGMYIGGLLGINSASQTVKDVSGATYSMSGMGFSAKGFGDMNISGGLGVIGRFGLEQLSLKGTAPGKDLNTSIMYVTGDLLLRYQFMQGASFVPFVAGGMGIHFPMSKSSNALQDIPTMTVFFFGAGVNYSMSDSMYLTAMGEYGMFPPSNDVATTLILVRGGLGYRF